MSFDILEQIAFQILKSAQIINTEANSTLLTSWHPAQNYISKYIRCCRRFYATSKLYLRSHQKIQPPKFIINLFTYLNIVFFIHFCDSCVTVYCMSFAPKATNQIFYLSWKFVWNDLVKNVPSIECQWNWTYF